MSTDDTHVEQAHKNAVARLNEARNMCKDALIEAELDGVPGGQCIANDAPPTEYNIEGSGGRPSWESSARQLHAATLSYWSEIRAYRSELSQWDKVLAQVERPVPADRWEQVKPTGELPKRYRGVSYEQKPLALSTLGRWRSRTLTLECRVEKRHSENLHRSRDEGVFLPLQAASLVIETLDDCLNDRDLLAGSGNGNGIDVGPR